MESIEQTFNGTVGVNARLTATVSRNGDLVHKNVLGLHRCTGEEIIQTMVTLV